MTVSAFAVAMIIVACLGLVRLLPAGRHKEKPRLAEPRGPPSQPQPSLAAR
jgi:hypothetical protein